MKSSTKYRRTCSRRQLQRSARGSVLVEFALLFPLFVTLVFGVLICLYAMYRNVALYFVASKGVRDGIVQARNARASDPTPFVMTQLRTQAARWGLQIDEPRVTFCPITNLGCGSNVIVPNTYFIATIPARLMQLEERMQGWNLASPFEQRALVSGVSADPIALSSF